MWGKFLILFVVFQLRDFVSSSSMEVEVRAEFDNDAETIDELQQVEDSLTKLVDEFHAVQRNRQEPQEKKKKSKKNYKEQRRPNLLRTTTSSSATTTTESASLDSLVSSSCPNHKERPLTTFVINLLKFFIRKNPEEAHTYAVILKRLLTNRFMADNGIYMLGSTFVSFLLNITKYSASVPPKYLHERLAYVLTFIENRDRKFGVEFNSIFNYAEEIYTHDDERKMEKLLLDIDYAKSRRPDIVEECIKIMFTRPLNRLAPFERDKLAFRIGSLIRDSKFHDVFINKIQRSDGSMQEPTIFQINIKKLFKNIMGMFE